MACRMKKQVLSYFLGELCEEEKKAIHNHAETCPECGGLLEEFGEAGEFLEKRTFPEVSDILVKDCLRKIKNTTRFQERASILERLSSCFIWRPKLVWRGAVFVAVFCTGVGLGKLLFDPPTWLERYERIFQNKKWSGKVNESRFLRNYFLSVETLLLDFANMENSALLDEEEWALEREVIREMLSRTRRIKEIAENDATELYRLVSEIEWVLENMLGTVETNLAELSEDVRKRIGEQQLLIKIYDYIS